MSEIRRRRWPIIKIAIPAMAILVVALIIFTIKHLTPPPPPAPDTPITDISQLTNQTPPTQGDYTFTNVKLTRTGAKNTITATLKYHGPTPTTAKITFTLANTTTDQLQGHKHITLTDLQPAEERPIEISIIGDFEHSSSYKLTAENL
jgi:hypothetical protein